MNVCTRNLLLMLGIASYALSTIAADVPEILPRPDKTPPTAGKVKVYILAGQSNMVGFGYLAGSRPTYESIFLSADPKIKVGRMPVGQSALLPHRVYQSEAPSAAAGAKAAIYPGAYKADVDYSAMKPAKEGTVALGTVEAQLPAIKGPHTVVVKAAIDVPMSGTFEVHPGFEDSTYAVATIAGQEVYRRDLETNAVVTPIALEQGKRYPLTITYMKGGSAALWLKQIELQGKGDLTTLTKAGKYPWFFDEEGKWTVRNDVT